MPTRWRSTILPITTSVAKPVTEVSKPIETTAVDAVVIGSENTGTNLNMDKVKEIVSSAIKYSAAKISAEILYNTESQQGEIADEKIKDEASSTLSPFAVTTLSSGDNSNLKLVGISPYEPLTIREMARRNPDVITSTLLSTQILVTSTLDTRDYGIPIETVKAFSDSLVNPFINSNPLLAGSAVAINNMIKRIETILNSNRHVSSEVLTTFKSYLLVVREGKRNYIDYKIEHTKAEEMRIQNDKMAYKIACLEQIVGFLTGDESRFSGNMSIKTVKPKRAIYATAIIDLVGAWYHVLFGNRPKDRKTMLSLRDFVSTLGSEIDAREQLYGILDDIYKNIDEDTENTIDVKLEENPYYKMLFHTNPDPEGNTAIDPDIINIAQDNIRDVQTSIECLCGKCESCLAKSVIKPYGVVSGGEFEGAIMLVGSTNIKPKQLHGVSSKNLIGRTTRKRCTRSHITFKENE